MRLYNKDQEVIEQGSGGYSLDLFGIGGTICIGQKMLCLPYAGFFVLVLLFPQIEILSVSCR